MSQYQPLLCIVDDDEDHCQALATCLAAENFRVVSFRSASEFLSGNKAPEIFDLVISDINMPGLTGFDLCRTLRERPSPVRLPIILITGADPSLDKARGLECGADEFISKPFSARLLVAKINSLLGIRAREKKQVQELESSRGLNVELQRFLSPNIANRLGVDERQSFLQPHRAEVTVLFADLRRFTAFSEKAEPEQVLEVLRRYYTAVGSAALKYKGTLGHLAGDGIMVFFNDPEPIQDHSEVALHMALEVRETLNAEKKFWDEKKYEIDFGMGLAEGFATIGGIGFDHFMQYSVIGTVANFASRLCDLANDGQILVSNRFLQRIPPERFHTVAIGNATLKGIGQAVSLHNVLQSVRRKMP